MGMGMGVQEYSRKIGEASSTRRAANNALGITRLAKERLRQRKRENREKLINRAYIGNQVFRMSALIYSFIESSFSTALHKTLSIERIFYSTLAIYYHRFYHSLNPGIYSFTSPSFFLTIFISGVPRQQERIFFPSDSSSMTFHFRFA